MATTPGSPASDEVFYNSLRGEDPLGAVVRAHIHIEARVYQVLMALTPYPSHLPKNLRYEQRVRLAVALGLNEKILEPLKVLGFIRNDFSHRVDVILSDAMVDRLWEAFSVEDQKSILASYAAMQLGLTGLPDFKKLDPRDRFVPMAVALDNYLIHAELEALRIS
jgi:hypothetical protein